MNEVNFCQFSGSVFLLFSKASATFFIASSVGILRRSKGITCLSKSAPTSAIASLYIFRCILGIAAANNVSRIRFGEIFPKSVAIINTKLGMHDCIFNIQFIAHVIDQIPDIQLAEAWAITATHTLHEYRVLFSQTFFLLIGLISGRVFYP